MIKTTTGNSIFASAINGIQQSYYLLGNGSSVSLENIVNPKTDQRLYSYLNQNFSSYLANNFAKFDTNSDGKISEDELTNYTNKMQTTGLSYSEMVQLCAQNGSSTLLETVLNNFNEVDANGDGRVTNAEITAYNMDKQKEELEEDHPRFDMNSITVFYSSNAAASEKTSKN